MNYFNNVFFQILLFFPSKGEIYFGLIFCHFSDGMTSMRSIPVCFDSARYADHYAKGLKVTPFLAFSVLCILFHFSSFWGRFWEIMRHFDDFEIPVSRFDIFFMDLFSLKCLSALLIVYIIIVYFFSWCFFYFLCFFKC